GGQAMSEQQTITTMDKQAARLLSEATREALEHVAERFGVTVRVGGGTFDPVSGSFKPKVEYTDPAGPEREFRANAFLFGLSPDDYGAEFTSQRKRFRVVGLNLRARTMPILCEEIATGRTFKFSERGLAGLVDAERAKSHE